MPKINSHLKYQIASDVSTANPVNDALTAQLYYNNEPFGIIASYSDGRITVEIYPEFSNVISIDYMEFVNFLDIAKRDIVGQLTDEELLSLGYKN